MASAATLARLLAVVAVATVAFYVAVRDRKGAGSNAVVELNATNFDAFLEASPEPFAIVAFTANWCRPCRNYRPHYEKVAKIFNGPEAAHHGIISMARVDCSTYLKGGANFWLPSIFVPAHVNMELCNRFSVNQYPFLLWGPPAKFASTKWDWRHALAIWDRRQKKSELKLIDHGRSAEHLLEWINKQMESSFSLDDRKDEKETLLPKNAS